jgi:thioredoxin reductase
VVLDVVIVGGGPAGLSAALTLGRARKRVLLSDGGSRRNAMTEHIHNFVTQDGTTPDEFRGVARAQLASYPNVDVRDVAVSEIRGERGAFEVQLDSGDVVEARRILLATGMLDVPPAIDGLRELWGRSVFICPYCHAWEHSNRRFGFLAHDEASLSFAVLLRSWTKCVVAFTNGQYDVAVEAQARLARSGVRVEDRPIARLLDENGHLARVQFDDGDALPLDVLFVRPPQCQVALVQSLGARVDASGYLEVDEKKQTTVPGMYAAGDLAAPVQGAILAAASGMLAAASLNHELTAELAASGALT